MAAQVAAHETINAGCMTCSATFGVATATQTNQEHESSLCRLCTKANQAWKDANEVFFSHLLKYDSQMAAFISAAEGTLQVKHDEIWRCVHSLMDTANIPHRICLPLALQTLDQLPAIPWDLSYHVGIPLMFTYGPKSYDFQTWITTKDGDYLLDNNAQATNLLSHKLACMAGVAGPDNSSSIRAASPAGLAGSATPPLQHIHHPDPTSELQFARLKRKGLILAPCPAPTPRRPNPSPQSPQTVKTVMMVTQHPKRAMSLKRKIRWTQMAEPQMTVKAQMVAPLMGEILVVAVKFQTLMARMKTLIEKLMNPAVKLKSQMLKVAQALQNLMMKLQPKQPTCKEDPRKQAQHLPDVFTAPLGQQGFQGGMENSAAQRCLPPG